MYANVVCSRRKRRKSKAAREEVDIECVKAQNLIIERQHAKEQLHALRGAAEQSDQEAVLEDAPDTGFEVDLRLLDSTALVRCSNEALAAIDVAIAKASGPESRAMVLGNSAAWLDQLLKEWTGISDAELPSQCQDTRDDDTDSYSFHGVDEGHSQKQCHGKRSQRARQDSQSPRRTDFDSEESGPLHWVEVMKEDAAEMTEKLDTLEKEQQTAMAVGAAVTAEELDAQIFQLRSCRNSYAEWIPKYQFQTFELERILKKRDDYILKARIALTNQLICLKSQKVHWLEYNEDHKKARDTLHGDLPELARRLKSLKNELAQGEQASNAYIESITDFLSDAGLPSSPKESDGNQPCSSLPADDPPNRHSTPTTVQSDISEKPSISSLSASNGGVLNHRSQAEGTFSRSSTDGPQPAIARDESETSGRDGWCNFHPDKTPTRSRSDVELSRGFKQDPFSSIHELKPTNRRESAPAKEVSTTPINSNISPPPKCETQLPREPIPLKAADAQPVLKQLQVRRGTWEKTLLGGWRCRHGGCKSKRNVFAKLDDLQEHLRNGHGTPAYICTLASCTRTGNSFSSTDDLEEHQKRSHSEGRPNTRGRRDSFRKK